MQSFGSSPHVRQLPSPPVPFNNPLLTIPKAPITIGIIVTSIFHSFFNSLARSRYWSFFSHSVLFCGQPGQQSRQFAISLFFFCWLLLGLVLWPILGDPCVCQSPVGVYMCYFLGKVLGWYGQIVGMVKFKFFAHFPVDHLAHPILSSLIFLLG